MSLYPSSIFLPPITFPKIVSESDNPVDDRTLVAEIEAAFEDFESELSVQLFHDLSPIGKRVSAFPSNLNDFVSSASNAQRSSMNRGAVGSPFYNMSDSLNLDSEFTELDLSTTVPASSRTSVSRLPRRVVRSRTQASLLTAPISLPTSAARRQDYSTVASLAASNSTELVSNSLVDLGGSFSTDSRLTAGVGEGDSSDNFLADEEEVEASRNEPESMNDSDEIGTVVR